LHATVDAAHSLHRQIRALEITLTIIIIIITMYRQALLKVKYCPWLAAVESAGSNKVAPSGE